jgi:hypothetical protein
MRALYGPRWAFRTLEVCRALDDRYHRTPVPWEAPHVRELVQEVMNFGYVVPDPTDPYDYLLPANSHLAA